MTTDSDSGIGLPGDIDADVEAIRTGADELEQLRLTLTGQTEETDTQFRSAAGEFTDLLAWDIGAAAADELILWEDTVQALAYGAATLRQWAQDVEKYRSERASIERRYDEARAMTPAHKTVPMGTTNQLREEHQGHWNTLMEQAVEARESLSNGPSADALARMASSGFLTGTQLSYFGDSYPGMLPDGLPDQADDPATVNTWWNSMTEEEQEEMLAAHPELLRSLDGIPSAVRDQLNRDHLDDEIERMEEEIAALEQENEDRPSSPGARISTGATNFEIEELNEDLGVLRELKSGLQAPPEGSLYHEEKFLLALDTEGQGRAIVAHGNPDTADNVATHVPGTTATWQKIDEQMPRGEQLAQNASDVDDDADTSAITWIGYNAPQSLGAASSHHATNAAEELSGFQEGLRATHQKGSPSHNTVIGHSYGSTVIGHTAQSEHGLDADNYVFVGSPGVGASHSDKLGIPSENIYATQAENDRIDRATGKSHDIDPTSEEFGATVFDAKSGTKGESFPFGKAHSEYFKEGNHSVVNMGYIIAGVEPPEGWSAR